MNREQEIKLKNIAVLLIYGKIRIQRKFFTKHKTSYIHPQVKQIQLIKNNCINYFKAL